jgi:FtsP/CotA-like multicopper oxidase with cupredoxin domain
MTTDAVPMSTGTAPLATVPNARAIQLQTPKKGPQLKSAAMNTTAPSALYPVGIGFNPAVDYTLPNFSYSPNIRKFMDSLPGLSAANKNNLGQYIPVAVPDTNTYPGSDFYDLGCNLFTVQMNSDLPPTTILGYYQMAGTGPGQSNDPNIGGVKQYLGPVVIAEVNRPVRFLFRNQLPLSNQAVVNGMTPVSDVLPLPIDKTIMGAGMGPTTGTNFTDNRVTTPHLHGGHTPWISDGTPHQWITPAGDTTPYKKGTSIQNVPDMIGAGKSIPTPAAGDGMTTAYFSNQQSARLMFFHDHAWGTTRLNVYAGAAAPYLLVGPVERDLISGTNVSGVFTAMGKTPTQILPDQAGLDNGTGLYHYGIPLVIQDKAFLNDANVPGPNALAAFPDPNTGYGHTYPTSVTDPLWYTYVNATGQKSGSLWIGHEYMPIENIFDPTGNTPNGRWDYAPFMIPPMMPTNLTLPSPTLIPEAFADTMVVNGCAFPYIELPPDTVRFRILGVGNDRVLNLSWFKADPLRINVTNGGHNYDANTVVTVTGNDPCATYTATANVSKGEITQISTDANNYISAPTVTITGNGTGAQAVAYIVSNSTGIVAIAVINGGSGYTNATVTLTGGGGTYSFATASVIPAGIIKSIDVTGAAGFKSSLAASTVVTITDPNLPGTPPALGSGAKASACVNTEVKMVAASPNPAYPTWPVDGRDGGVPDPTTTGPDWMLIGNESGFLAQEVNYPAQPIDFEYNRQSIPLAGVTSRSLLIMPAQRVDVVVDFRGYKDGDTLILYNDAPAPMPNYWAQNDFYTDDPNLDNIQRPTTPPGFGPNTRTVMQIRIKGTKTSTFNFDPNALKTALPKAFALSNQKPIVPQLVYNDAFPGFAASNIYAQAPDTTLNVGGAAGAVTRVLTTAPGNNYAVAPTVTIVGGGGTGATATAGLNPCGGVTLLTTGSGYTSVPTVTIGPPGAGGVQATAVATISGGGVNAINMVEPGSNYSTTVAPTVTITGGGGTGATASTFVAVANTVGSITLTAGGSGYTYQPQVYIVPAAGSNGMGASAVALINGAIPMTGKSITEGFDPDYGRMDIRMGSTPNPLTPSVGSGMVLGLARYIDPPTEFVTDGNVTLWRIGHLGVDSHALHFHLFDVQVVNRVDWTNVLKPPYADEIGWRDTIRTNPMEDIIVAFRPTHMVLPFAIPDSNRLLDPTTPLNSTANFLPVAPPAGVAAVAQLSNVMTNFAWEYVWHCHMLGHEENDFMRPMCMNVVAGSYIIPLAPTSVVATAGLGQATVTFTVPVSNGAAITKYIVTAIPATSGALGTDITTSATARIRTISGLTGGVAYTFTVAAQSAAGTGLSSAPSNSVTILTPTAPTAPSNLRSTARTTTSITLAWTNTAGTNAQGFYIERSPNPVTTWTQVGSTAANTLTFRNTGLTTLTTYNYRVRAHNATGNSGYSNTLTVTTR